ncbi:MAG TPA: protein kinase [Myxococcales bacterium]|nr:protein kinase [Myxococcales bacterium]
MTGTVLIDRYVLGAVLGRGGMGLVHQAVDRKLQREVAVKLLSSATADGEQLRRFSREALAAGSLQHPNVVGVFDTGEQQGRPFLVTELLQGETLRQRLARGAIPLLQARSWAEQLAAGLSAAHAKGLVHRDLKPSNIFITSDGFVKILDFGLVQLAESLEPDSHRIAGTIGYMAPEQVRGLPVDARADLFSFGVVLYEMLAGRRVFAGKSSTETSYDILLREPPPLPDSVPAGLRRLVYQCLAKDRDQRPSSAGEVLRLLRAPGPERRLRLPAIALSLLAVAALVAFWHDRRNTPVPAGTVAIFAFDAPGLPARASLAAGMNDLLRRDLQATALRPLDDSLLDQPHPGLASLRRDAVKLRASYFVFGHLAERGGDLTLTAELHDTESERLLTSAAARGKPSDLLQLVRQLSDQLQRRRLNSAESAARLEELQRLTTPSFPALQAWLDGRLNWSSSNYEAATGDMTRAVRLDPEFAQAIADLARLAASFRPEASEEAIRQSLLHLERLSVGDRMAVQALALQRAGDLKKVQEFLAGAAREHPDDLETRRLISGYAFHRGPLMGLSPQEAMDSLQRQLELDPMDGEALGRHTELAILRGERAAVAELADRMISRVDNEVERAYYQLASAWARGDQASHDEAMAVLRRPRAEQHIARVALLQVAAQMNGSDDLQTLAALFPLAEPRQGFQARALADLVTGHIDAARRDVEAGLAAGAGGDSAYYLPWIDALDLVSPSPEQLAQARATAARLEVSKDPTRAAAKLSLIGALALRANDLEAARQAVHALEALAEIPGSTIVADHALALRARILAAEGDPAAALQTYDRQRLIIPERYTHFYRRPRDHFFRASLLVALGRPREALPLYEALAMHSLIDAAFYPAGQLHIARIYDGLGETERAIDHYERFVAMWRDCDPAERPALESARERLQQLRAAH